MNKVDELILAKAKDHTIKNIEGFLKDKPIDTTLMIESKYPYDDFLYRIGKSCIKGTEQEKLFGEDKSAVKIIAVLALNYYAGKNLIYLKCKDNLFVIDPEKEEDTLEN